jgi:hypothetical protein
MGKWWHTVGSIGLAAFSIATPDLQALIASHPAIAGSLAAVWGIIGHLIPSPVSSGFQAQSKP